MRMVERKLILPFWGLLLTCFFLGYVRTAILVDKSSSISSSLDDKGSSSVSEDFIDLDAPPSHVLHEVGEGTNESEIGDFHESPLISRPKTSVELDSDEAEDIHSGSGDDLETASNERNNEKHNITDDAINKINATTSTSTVAYPSSTQANYNPSTSTTSTQITYTSTPSVNLRSTSRSSPILTVIKDTTKPATHSPTIKSLESTIDESDEELSGSGSGSGENQCNSYNCKFGGVCDHDSEDFQCNCDFDCNKEKQELLHHKIKSDSHVCGSDGILHPNLCVMKRTSCLQQKLIKEMPRRFCIKTKPESHKKNCNEHESSANWGPWSPWIQSGDKDYRIRSCNITVAAGKNATNITCVGERIQFRNCPVTEKKTCNLAKGGVKSSLVYGCNGHNPMDIDTKYPQMFANIDNDECLYSLYQVDAAKYKYVDWTYERLQQEGKLNQWCGGPLRFGDEYRLKQHKRRENNMVAIYSPMHSCKQKLEKFCRESMPPCKYSTRDSKGFTNDKFHVECLQEFTLGGSVPSGIRNQNGGATYLCQRFSSNTLFGDLFKRKHAHFATLYDSLRRVPTFSMSKLTAIDNKGWPRTPYLTERALIDKQAHASWFYIVQYRKKGLAALTELEDDIKDDQCAVGKYQPLPSDYDFTTTHRIGHLLPPQLAGHYIDTKIAAFALTNTVPMHLDFYKEWKKAAKMIIEYAVDECGIPQIDAEKTVTDSTDPAHLSSTPITTIATPLATKATNLANTKNIGTSGSSTMTESSNAEKKNNKPQLYLVAGAVPSIEPEVTLGNGVNIPTLIWMGGCCVRGNDTKGFAVYGQNAAGRLVGATSLPQLEILLSQEYTKHTSRAHAFKIKIFPAYQGQCSKAPNDDSLKIAL